MSTTLTDIRTRAAVQLDDTHNLIWPASALDEAARSALAELSRVSGVALTLSGLDDAEETTVPDTDVQALIAGVVAFALRFRAVGSVPLPEPHDRNKPAALPELVAGAMDVFQSHLDKIRIRYLQESPDHPWSSWDWDG